MPAQDRELRAQGRETVRKLLEAGIIEFEERGFVGVRVDDVVKRAGISHGTFYLYFSNKEDLFKALLRDALHDMEIVAGDFPVVTSDETGLAVLRQWVRKFSAAYAAHGTVLRTLVSANAPMEIFSDGLQLFYSITQSMTTGMTAAAAAAGHHQENAELTAFACLMMLERVNFVMTTEVPLPADDDGGQDRGHHVRRLRPDHPVAPVRTEQWQSALLAVIWPGTHRAVVVGGGRGATHPFGMILGGTGEPSAARRSGGRGDLSRRSAIGWFRRS